MQGSVEAAVSELEKIKSDEVAVRVMHTGVGGIVESDVMLAAASEAIVVGFNVRPNAEAKQLADREGVDIRTYRVIYQLTEDIEKALVGLLTPETVEDVVGEAEVRATFRASRSASSPAAWSRAASSSATGASACCATARSSGRAGSARSRFQEDAREVAQGFECGILLDGYQDAKVGDMIECYVTRQVERSTLDEPAAATPS